MKGLVVVVKSPLEVLREQQAAKLDAVGPLVNTSELRDRQRAELAETDRVYAEEWKSLTTGKDAKWTEEELIASGLGRPVPARQRAKSSKSRRPEGKPGTVEADEERVPATERDGL